MEESIARSVAKSVIESAQKAKRSGIWPVQGPQCSSTGYLQVPVSITELIEAMSAGRCWLNEDLLSIIMASSGTLR